jgi:hypothetical protein
MSTTGNPLAIVGTDGFSPIYNPEGRFQQWDKAQIYLGREGKNKYVPNVRDHVVETIGRRIMKYIVTSLSVELVPALEAEDQTLYLGDMSQYDWLVGVGLGARSDYYLAYVDKRVKPNRLCIDTRLVVPGSAAAYCKVFRGATLDDSGVVVSRVYSPGGQFLSENIPLELVATGTMNNLAIKTPVAAHTNLDLINNERLTAVFYDNNGTPMDRRNLVVHETGYIRSLDAGKKYIISVELESPFIDRGNPRLISYPINLPLQGLNLTAVVTYSNGTQTEVKRFGIDQSKVELFGFSQYVSTRVGRKFEVVLKYHLGADEISYDLNNVGNTSITVKYSAVTLNADGVYGMQLYAYPVWKDAVSGYSLKWWMYNLRRNVFFDVTDQVRINTTLSAFNPLSYGVLQRLSVSINLRDVNPMYRSYVHTQVMDVVLEAPGSDRSGTNWSVGFVPTQEARYGIGIHATTQYLSAGRWNLNITSGITKKSEWIERIYRATQPLSDPGTEYAAPEPTHFVLIIGDLSAEYPIDQWNSNFTVTAEMRNSQSVFIRFIHRTPTDDLQLSIAGMIVYQLDATGAVLGA